MTGVSFTVWVMRTTSTTEWWSCAGCGADAELAGGDLTGFEVPCPDCGQPMTAWLRWDAADQARGRSAA